MARRIRVKALADISSRRELREALAETELRTWYAERRLREGFSLEKLLPGGFGIGNLIGKLFHRS